MDTFSKSSRYRKSSVVVTTDARGRSLRSTALRLPPEVSGDFVHTVEEVDRLDHLAFKYYRQPRKWWRICDANAEFASPLALLGQEPLVTACFSLVWKGFNPPWTALLHALADQVGVEDVGMGTSDQPFPDVLIIESDLLFAMDVSLAADLNAGVLTQETSAALRQALQDKGVTLASEVRFSFVDQNQWRITDQTSKQIHTFKLEEGALNVYESVARHTWAVMVTFNKVNVSVEALADIVAAVGFETSQPQHLDRIGKRIVIPPDAAG